MKQFQTNTDAYNWLQEQCCEGYEQQIQRGSFAGEDHTFRMQAPPVMLQILQPTNFLYLPRTVTVGMIEDYYCNKIIGNQKHYNEVYTYGERILTQLNYVLEMLRRSPMTNQAAITISRPEDVMLDDPPCLREIVFSFFDDRLHITSFWRSNDIGEAFLMNQGGLALLLSDAAKYAGVPVGTHYYVSPGAHVYVRS